MEKNIVVRKIRNLFIYITLSIYSLISLYPLIWMLFYSFKNNAEIYVTNPFGFPKVLRVENYIMAVTQYNIVSFFKNSVIVSTVSIIVGLSLCLMFAYAVSRMQWKLSGVVRNYISIGLFLPVQIVLVPLVLVVRDLHMTDTLLSIIVPYIAFSFSLSTIILYGFYRGIPFELEESAAIDGASIYSAFFKIILPIMKPAIATLIIFQFMNHWNEFTLALILISKESLKTLPLGLVYFQGQFSVNLGAMGASLVIASFPTILIYMFFSEKVEKAVSVGASLKV